MGPGLGNVIGIFDVVVAATVVVVVEMSSEAGNLSIVGGVVRNSRISAAICAVDFVRVVVVVAVAD